MQEMKYFNEGNDCDICKNQLMTGRDGTVEDCRRRQNGLSCRFEERDIRTCPVCEHEVDREDMYFTKDCHGKYILQPNPTQPTQMMLFGKYPIAKVSNRTVKSEPVYSPAFTISGSKLAIDGTTTAIDASATSDVTAWKVVKGKYVVTCKGQEQETTVDAKVSAYKHPVYMGDLKEAITLFDRNVITIDMNDKAAGLWEKDMTGIKVRDRFDVQPVDDGAIIKGNITEVVQG